MTRPFKCSHSARKRAIKRYGFTGSQAIHSLMGQHCKLMETLHSEFLRIHGEVSNETAVVMFQNSKDDLERDMIVGYIYLQNAGIMYRTCEKFWNIPDKLELMSLYYYGFTKALMTYNPEIAKFTTYMGKVVYNEMYMYIRSQKSESHSALNTANSLHYVVSTKSNDGRDVLLEDIICRHDDDHSLFESDIPTDEWFAMMSPRNREIIESLHNGETQKQIGKRLGLSQSYISRIQKKQHKILRCLIDGTPLIKAEKTID